LRKTGTGLPHIKNRCNYWRKGGGIEGRKGVGIYRKEGQRDEVAGGMSSRRNVRTQDI
jgi:hypothetical protein